MSLIEKLAKLNEDANFSLRLLVPLTIKGFQNLHVIEQQVVEIKNQLVKLNNYVDERGQCIDKQADEALELEATASGSFRQDSLVYERKGNAAMMRSLKHNLASIVVDSDAAENEYFALQEAKTTQRQKITALAREISHERQRIDKEEKAKAAEAEEQKRKRREVERKRQAAEQELRRKATEEAERKRKAEEEAVRKRKATEEEAKRKQLAEEPKKRGRPKRIEVVPKKNQLNFEQNKPRTPVKRRNAPSPTSSVAEMEDDGDVMFLAFKQPAILVPKSPHILPQAGKNNFGTPDNRNVSVSQQNKKPSTWSIPDTPPPRKIPALGSSANKSTSTVTTKNMPPQTPNKTVNKPLQGRQQQQSIVGTPRNHNQPSTSNNNYHAAPAPPPAKKNPDLEKTMDTDYDFSSADDSFWGED